MTSEPGVFRIPSDMLLDVGSVAADWSLLDRARALADDAGTTFTLRINDMAEPIGEG